MDSSVILRRILGQAGALKEWPSIERAVASALVETECLRTLDRARVAGALTDTEVARRRKAVYEVLEMLELIGVTRPVLSRASQPFSTVLGTLDAIHLASALIWREQSESEIVMATHDAALATAARANGLAAIGA